MKDQHFDSIVAGAGIWGCTVARRLAEAGKKVLVLEKRPVVGGNVRCEIDPETGIEIHTYGSHIFHTHIPEVWEFVNRFVKFNGYQHRVLACTKKVGGESRWTKDGARLYHLPLGLTLINKFFDVELAPGEVEAFLSRPFLGADLWTNNGGAPRTSPPTNRDALFEAFFRGYTSKQWGKSPEEIDPSIIKRVPVRSNYDTNYFNDYNQGIPLTGYNSLFDRLLDHTNITVQCNCSLRLEEGKAKVEGEQWINPLLSNQTIKQSNNQTIFYSGPIDALFNYKYGALPWRTLRFERETLNCPDYQGTSVVNYTDIDVPYTRIHEFKHYHPEGRGLGQSSRSTKDVNLHCTPTPTTYTSSPDWGFDAPKTVIMREYPAQWKPGDEPYYPIDTPDSRALLAKYQEEVEKLNHHSTTTTSNCNSLIVGGRLGGYKYYDMDKSIEAALKVEIA